MDNDRHKIWHIDRSSLEEQFCVSKIFKMSAIFKMAAKTWHKKWAVKNQHFPISSKFGMWVHNDVPNWFPPLKNFYQSPFSKWSPQSDFNDVSYVGRLWCPELIPDIEKFLPVAIFKMATTRPHKFNIVRFQRNFICR
jgi:hypothetical protein